jgi:hypothetical protein
MPRFRLTAPKLKTLEKHVMQACVQLVTLRGYRAERLHNGKSRWPGTEGKPARWVTQGEPGRPDYLVARGDCPAFYLETKRPGGQLSPDQELFHMHVKRSCGLETLVVDSVEDFNAWLDERERRLHIMHLERGFGLAVADEKIDP